MPLYSWQYFFFATTKMTQNEISWKIPRGLVLGNQTGVMYSMWGNRNNYFRSLFLAKHQVSVTRYAKSQTRFIYK